MLLWKCWRHSNLRFPILKIIYLSIQRKLAKVKSLAQTQQRLVNIHFLIILYRTDRDFKNLLIPKFTKCKMIFDLLNLGAIHLLPLFYCKTSYFKDWTTFPIILISYAQLWLLILAYLQEARLCKCRPRLACEDYWCKLWYFC